MGIRRRLNRRDANWLAAAFFAALLILGVSMSESSARPQLRLLESHRIADRSEDFTEVSGLGLAAEGGFWSVSDDTPRLFRLDLLGKVLPEQTLAGDTGLEGIEYDAARNRLLAVREDSSEILEVSPGGDVRRMALLAMKGARALLPYLSNPDSNDGLEGITVEPESGTVLVVKERGPRLLIEVSPDLTEVRRILPLSPEMGFVSPEATDDELDVSGLAWDAGRYGLWITSDTGKAIYFLDLEKLSATGWQLIDTTGKKPSGVSNAEGVALSADGKTLYVVTDDDRNSRLLIYAID